MKNVRNITLTAFWMICFLIVHGQQDLPFIFNFQNKNYRCEINLEIVAKIGNKKFNYDARKEIVILKQDQISYLSVYLYRVKWDPQLPSASTCWTNKKLLAEYSGLDLRMGGKEMDIRIPSEKVESKIPINFEITGSEVYGTLKIPLKVKIDNSSAQEKIVDIPLKYIITKAQDYAEWISIRSNPNPQNLTGFIKSFPKSQFIDRANEEYKKLDLKAWNSINKTSQTEINKYLTDFPKGRFRKEALEVFERLNFKRDVEESDTEIEIDDKEVVEIKPDPLAGLSREERAWNNIKNTGNAEEFQDFINQYPESKFKEKAIKAIQQFSNISYNISREGEQFVINLEDVFRPYLNFDNIDFYTKLNAIWDTSQLRTQHICKVAFKVPGEYEIWISDQWGKDVNISLYDILTATCEEIEGEGYRVSIKGGKPPFRILLKKEDGVTSGYTKKDLKSRSVDLDIRELIKNRLDGEYRVFVKDRTSATIELGKVVTITPPFRVHPVVWLFGVGALLFFFWRYIIQRIKNPKTVFDVKQ